MAKIAGKISTSRSVAPGLGPNFANVHDIEPHFAWLGFYSACEDPRSPFFEREYSEFYFEHTVYNYLIHPQWDHFGSNTLYLKVLFADYQDGYAILEFIGEWNDALYNDIMTLKREVLEILMEEGIRRFVIIGENVLNFHSSDDSYYEEWFQDVDLAGWIALVNFRDHVMDEMRSAGIDYYLNFGGELDDIEWRKMGPRELYGKVESLMSKRLGA